MKKNFKIFGLLSLAVLTSCNSTDIIKNHFFFLNQNVLNFSYKIHEKYGNFNNLNILNKNDIYSYNRTSLYRSKVDDELTAVVRNNSIYTGIQRTRNIETVENVSTITFIKNGKVLDNKYCYLYKDDNKLSFFDNDDKNEVGGQFEVGKFSNRLPGMMLDLSFLNYARDEVMNFITVDKNGNAFLDDAKIDKNGKYLKYLMDDYIMFGTLVDVDDDLKRVESITGSKRDSYNANVVMPSSTSALFDDNYKLTECIQHGFNRLGLYNTYPVFVGISTELKDFKLIGSYQNFKNVTNSFDGFKNLDKSSFDRLNIAKSNNSMDEYIGNFDYYYWII